MSRIYREVAEIVASVGGVFDFGRPVIGAMAPPAAVLLRIAP